MLMSRELEVTIRGALAEGAEVFTAHIYSSIQTFELPSWRPRSDVVIGGVISRLCRDKSPCATSRTSLDKHRDCFGGDADGDEALAHHVCIHGTVAVLIIHT